VFVGLEQAIRDMLELLGSRKISSHAD